MLSSFKHRTPTVYFLTLSLVVAGLLQSAPRPSEAAHGVTSNERVVPEASAVDEATKKRVSAAYNQLPLRFEENRGQVDERFKYLSRNSTSTLYLSPTEAILVLSGRRGTVKETRPDLLSALHQAQPAAASSTSIVRMRLHGANHSPRLTGESELQAKANYFIGNDPQKWHTDVPQYERVRYEQVYPGIDMIYYGQQQSLEYDFEIAPGADPQQIMLGFKGVRKLRLEAGTGDLLLRTASGELRQHKPVAYQEIDGERREVESRYVMKGQRKVGFRLGDYDRTKPLVIDPVIRYSSYFGSNGDDSGNGIAVDGSGNAWVAGDVSSFSPFPGLVNTYDAFVIKINPNAAGAASLLYSAYLGGSTYDFAHAIAVDSSGNAYVTGQTYSPDFPTLNQFQNLGGSPDCFITKLNTNLPGPASLVYSSYLGGSFGEFGFSLALGPSGIVYVLGGTESANFPTRNAYQPVLGGNYDVFLAKFDTNLSGTASFLYGTFMGGAATDEGEDLVVDSSGIAYLTGVTRSTNFPTRNAYQPSFPGGPDDCFIAKLDTNVSGAAGLLYSTYLGGSSGEEGRGIVADAAGNAYVVGGTRSTNFPKHNQYQTTLLGGEDAFVTKIDTNLSGTASLLYSTYLGGSADEFGYDIALSSPGIVYLVGETTSSNFPTRNSFQTLRGGEDTFVTKLDTNSSGAAALLYSTLIGGDGEDKGFDITLDSSGNIYLTGYTDSTNFPLRNAYQVTNQGLHDAFIMKISFTSVDGDFDADRKTDLALWHPMSGDWEYLRSLDGAPITRHWGASGDKPVPSYYDGDGQTDFAVYRPSEGIWYIFQSFDQSVKTIYLGTSTDIPVAADYDGDGQTDAAVYRPSDGLWDIRQSSNNNVVEIHWGASEDKPVPADYDRDGKADLAVYRPSNNYWYILQSSNNSLRAVPWGVSGDKPVVGDYDGDERADVAVWRPSTGTWYALRSSDGSLFAAQWGAQGDVPVPGDYDADGKTDTAVWRPTTGYWYILRSSDGMLIQQQFGSSGDVPVPATYLPE